MPFFSHFLPALTVSLKCSSISTETMEETRAVDWKHKGESICKQYSKPPINIKKKRSEI